MGPPVFEMLIPRRPVSLQSKNAENRQAWKDFVYGRARQAWKGGAPVCDQFLRFTLVYLCNDAPADIDNIIKPIQDALVGVVYADDFLISDVDAHRRFLSDNNDITELPGVLMDGIACGQEGVYIRVSLSETLEHYL